jgi:hypothetical protein
LHGGKALPTDSIARERRGITRYWRVLKVKKKQSKENCMNTKRE